MTRPIFSFLFALLLSTSTVAGSPAFQKGDRVTFIGVSITHGGSYHSNAVLFYATRFPNAPFMAYNCGISGDTAVGTNVRFESDIAIHQPNVATIMLGMNDAWSWCFQENATEANKRTGPGIAYNTYTNAMVQLASTLADAGVRTVFITPSIYDQTAVGTDNNLIGKNDLLSRYTEFLNETAPRFNATIIDFNRLMNRINLEIQRKDPRATVVGPDRVHPGPAGHFLMTYAFLKAQDMPALVSHIGIDAATGQTELRNCSLVDGMERNGPLLSFSCLENALPYPVDPNQKEALNWVPFQTQLNQQILQVHNLEAGSYALTIDEVEIGTYTAEQLAGGINLSDKRKTPQFQQALAVKAVQQSQLSVVSKLRAIVHVRHTILSKMKPKPDESDPGAVARALQNKLNEAGWSPYLKNQVKVYLEHVQHEDRLKAERDQQMQKVWTVNQPRTHRWTISRLND